MKSLMIIGCLVLTGCASELVVSNNETEGVPVPFPRLVTQITSTEYEVAPGATNPNAVAICAKNTEKAELKFLPLGKVMYVGFKPAWLGKSEFKVEYNDSGMLKSVSLNSDPTAAVEASAGMLSTILPYLGKPQFEAVEKSTADEERAKNCLVKKTSIDLAPAPSI